MVSNRMCNHLVRHNASTWETVSTVLAGNTCACRERERERERVRVYVCGQRVVVTHVTFSWSI